MHDDDMPIGRVLSRREVLALLGSTGMAALLTACFGSSTPPAGNETSTNTTPSAPTDAPLATACVVKPELTEGPLFVDTDLNRSDIRTDPSNGAVSAGVPFELTFRVSQIANAACTALSGVQVDVWHCDADGIYSDTDQLGMQTVGQKFLRGYQLTDDSGVATFTTIYPGWYSGRAVHIHFKIRTADGYDFTSQLFFDESLNDTVLSQPPYNTRGERSLRNENDGIYNNGGDQLLLNVTETDSGYAAVFDVALDLT